MKRRLYELAARALDGVSDVTLRLYIWAEPDSAFESACLRVCRASSEAAERFRLRVFAPPASETVAPPEPPQEPPPTAVFDSEIDYTENAPGGVA